MNEDKPERMPNTPPFVRFVCSAIPMVFDDSLSYYEALCALWKYVQGMTDVINNNATLEEEYILKFNELKTFVDTYFDNLDVQEEINNKLDQMVEDGTLQEIITDYIQANVAWTFDTVADMKVSENLINGSYAQTLGFHSVGDGGGALYKITDTGTADEMYIIAIGSSLYANLVIKDYITPEVLGAYGDNVHDDTAAVQACLSNTDFKHSVLSKSYKITSALSVPNYKLVDGNGSIYSTGTCFELDGIAHITLRDLHLYPQLNAIHITSTSGWCNYNVFENIFANGNETSATKGLYIEVTDNYINEQSYYNCVFWNFGYGIYADNSSANKEMTDHNFYSCSSEQSETAGQYIKKGTRFRFINCRHTESISCKWITEGVCNHLLIIGGQVEASNLNNINFSSQTNGQIIGGLRYSGIYASNPCHDGIISEGKVVPTVESIPTSRETFDADKTYAYGGLTPIYFSGGGSTDTTLTLPRESYGGNGKINQFYVRVAKTDGTSKTYVSFTNDGVVTNTKTLPAQNSEKAYRFTYTTLGGGQNWFVEPITSI